MPHIEIIHNSEKYMNLLEKNDKISIRQSDIIPSQDLIDRYDTLWGYYDVILPKNNNFVGYTGLNEGLQWDSNSNLHGYKIICGDFFCGSGFLQKIHIASNSKEFTVC